MSKYISRLLHVKNIEYIILSIFIFLGFVVRLFKINSPVADWHSFRQADTASVSEYIYQGKGSLFVPKYHDISRVQSGKDNPEGYRFVEFPIYNFIVAEVYSASKVLNLEQWGRLVSILSALTTSYLLFLLGKRFVSSWGGVWAAFYYLFIPFNIYFTRVILPEPLSVMFGVAALYFFTRFSDGQKTRHLLFSGILLGLGILVKPYVAFYTVPMLYIFFTKTSVKKALSDLKILSFIFICLAPFFAWRIWISSHPEGIPFFWWTLNGDGIRFKPAFWYWIIGERLTKLILGYLGMIPFVIGVLSAETKKLFIHFFALGMFLYVSVIATANVKHDYYQTLVIPAISLVLAWGSIKLWGENSFNIHVRRGVLIFSVGLMLMTGAMQVREYYKIDHPEIIAAGAEVNRLTPKDSLVVAAYNGDTAFLYQTKRKGWPVVELPINELIQKGAAYYASVNLNDKQTLEFMDKFEVVEKTDSFVILKLQP